MRYWKVTTFSDDRQIKLKWDKEVTHNLVLAPGFKTAYNGGLTIILENINYKSFVVNEDKDLGLEHDAQLSHIEMTSSYTVRVILQGKE